MLKSVPLYQSLSLYWYSLAMKGTIVFHGWKVKCFEMIVVSSILASTPIRSMAGRFPSCWAQTNPWGKHQHIWTNCMRLILGIPKAATSHYLHSPTRCYLNWRRQTAHIQKGLRIFVWAAWSHTQIKKCTTTDIQRTSSNGDAEAKRGSRYHIEGCDVICCGPVRLTTAAQ